MDDKAMMQWLEGKARDLDITEPDRTAAWRIRDRLMDLLEATGNCPECGRAVRDWKPPLGAFAPEAWASLSESGIDPSTGHANGCSRSRK